MPETQPHLRDVLLVGSTPLSSSSEAFHRFSEAFPNRLRRIPDGETGGRRFFVAWQAAVFAPSPFVMQSMNRNYERKSAEAPSLPTGQIKLNPTGFDDAALASYAEFCTLREKGVIKQGTRFQVCLPTPLNVITSSVDLKYRPEVEVLYEKLLMEALRRIQDNIPKEDLAIQWDAPMEFAMLENVPIHFTPWFSPVKEGLTERLKRIAEAVDEGVELGFHLCYGDRNRKHFVEPKDTGHLADVSNAILTMVQRPVQWIHMPVPKDRTDLEYFAPLKTLKLRDETKIYLGLVHADDVEGTKKRIETASKVLDGFGVSTECGMGRMTMEEFDKVIEVFQAAT